ncbi:16249_t:CDS:2, partial [Gigaspora rosea]
MCVKSVDKCGGLTRQKVDSDNEKMNKDENRLVEVAGLENESAKEINIKSNRSIGAGDSCKLDDLKAEVGLLLL